MYHRIRKISSRLFLPENAYALIYAMAEFQGKFLNRVLEVKDLWSLPSHIQYMIMPVTRPYRSAKGLEHHASWLILTREYEKPDLAGIFLCERRSLGAYRRE